MSRTIPLDDFKSPALSRVMKVLNSGEVETRIVGGAVRNHLLGEAVSDIDLATTGLPETVTELAKAAGLHVAPTGIEHGTVTVIADDTPFEVTTLREDIETDGRRAVVRFGKNWEHDATRRDFTINALYVDADGVLHDPLGGLPDIEARAVRFIGAPEDRIREDYLRILRFFRFHARYGSGRPDAAGLKACGKLKGGIARLSVERVWKELRQLFAAQDPGIAIRWMRVSGVLDHALPEQTKWGIDFLQPLITAERIYSWSPDPLLRLMSIIPPRAEVTGALSERLKISNAERERLRAFAIAQHPLMALDEGNLAVSLYRYGAGGIMDALRIMIARRHEEDEAEAHRLNRLLEAACDWERPQMPVAGRDLIERGMPAGPQIGEALDRLEKIWIDSGFTMGRAELLERL